LRHICYLDQRSRITYVYILAAFLIAGIIAGAFFQAKYSPDPSAAVHQYAAPVYHGESLIRYISHSFALSVITLTAAFVLGFFALGQPFGPLLLIYKGFGIGASAAFLYSSFGTKAALSVAVLILPKAFFSALVLILGIRELLRASVYTLSCWTGGDKSEHQEAALKLYCTKYLVLILISLIISASDAGINLLFAGLS